MCFTVFLYHLLTQLGYKSSSTNLQSCLGLFSLTRFISYFWFLFQDSSVTSSLAMHSFNTTLRIFEVISLAVQIFIIYIVIHQDVLLKLNNTMSDEYSKQSFMRICLYYYKLFHCHTLYSAYCKSTNKFFIIVTVATCFCIQPLFTCLMSLCTSKFQFFI